jgi:hypothetical protein
VGAHAGHDGLGLVEGAAGRVHALGEHVDRHLVQRKGGEHLVLVRCERLADSPLERGQQLGRLVAPLD